MEMLNTGVVTGAALSHARSEPMRRSRVPVSVVAKPTGAACNLDCTYCFFLSKSLLYDSANQRMGLDTLETYVAEYLAAAPDGEVTMLWQGGEPTLRGLPFFRELIRLCESYRRPTQRVVHALQTNATLIERRWADFLAENDFLVGVSFDGPAFVHDTYRVNRAGRPTHAMTLRGWQALQEAGVRCNVLCAVHSANQDRGPEVYRYLRDDLGARYLQFIPIVERTEDVASSEAVCGSQGWGEGRPLYRQRGHGVTSRSVEPGAYGRFMTEVFGEWVQRDVGKVFVTDFDAALSSLFGRYPVCVHAPECGNNLAMEFNGDVYACDHWVEPEWKVGNVVSEPFSQLVSGEVMREFSRKKSGQLTDQCLRCPVRRMCQGGCPKDRFVTSVDGQPGHSYLCSGYASFFQAIRPDVVAMARLVGSGRAPAEIMDPQVRQQMSPQPGTASVSAVSKEAQ